MRTHFFRRSGASALLAVIVVACGEAEHAPQPSSTPNQPASSKSGGMPTADARTAALLQAFEGGEASAGKNVLFVVDGSGSMNDACEGTKKIKTARIAGREFLSTLDENVRIGLICFYGGRIHEAVPLGLNNRAEFLEALDDLTPGGGTPLTESIIDGLDALAMQRGKQLGYGTFKVVAVTDGENTSGPNIENAVRRSIELKIPIFTIGLCVGGSHALNQDPRYYRDANNVAELQRGLEEALAEAAAFDATVFEGK